MASLVGLIVACGFISVGLREIGVSELGAICLSSGIGLLVQQIVYSLDERGR